MACPSAIASSDFERVKRSLFFCLESFPGRSDPRCLILALRLDLGMGTEGLI